MYKIKQANFVQKHCCIGQKRNKISNRKTRSNIRMMQIVVHIMEYVNYEFKLLNLSLYICYLLGDLCYFCCVWKDIYCFRLSHLRRIPHASNHFLNLTLYLSEIIPMLEFFYNVYSSRDMPFWIFMSHFSFFFYFLKRSYMFGYFFATQYP